MHEVIPCLLTMHVLAFSHRMRSEDMQKQIVAQIQHAKDSNQVSLAKQISTKFSTHSMQSAFYGLGVVDIHEKLTHEKLHNNSLGVTRLVLRLIEIFVNSNFVPKKVKDITRQLNDRLSSIDKCVCCVNECLIEAER